MIKKFPIISKATGREYMVRIEKNYGFDRVWGDYNISLFIPVRIWKLRKMRNIYTTSFDSLDFIAKANEVVMDYEAEVEKRLKKEKELERQIQNFNDWNGVVE